MHIPVGDYLHHIHTEPHHHSYKEGKKLNGILYLSRISDIRVGSATPHNFCRFRKLCGDDTLKNVVIVTTMWDITPCEAAVRKEQEMAQNPALFKPAIDRGAQMARHYNTIESAHHILRIVLGFPPELLRIQRELVDEGKALSGTSAAMGLALEARFIEELAKVGQQRDAMLRERDELRAREIQAVTAQLSAMRVARDRLESENRALAEALEAEKERSRRLTEEGQRRDVRHRQEQAARKIEMEAAAALTRAEISRRDKELLQMRVEVEATKAREHKEAIKHERERLALLMEKERLQREHEAERLMALEDSQRDAANRKKKAILGGVLGLVLGAAAALM